MLLSIYTKMTSADAEFFVRWGKITAMMHKEEASAYDKGVQFKTGSDHAGGCIHYRNV